MLLGWSTVSGINCKPKYLFPENMFQATHELQHLQETVLSPFRPERKERSLCCNSLKITLLQQGEKYTFLQFEGVFTIQVSMQGDRLCVYPSTEDIERPAYPEQENKFSGPDSDGLLYSEQTSPDSHWGVTSARDVCSSEGNEAPHMNPKLLKDTVTKVVE
ncbi:hypothetical protein TNCV_204431 [Trichonephila clavipes]|nr:hypothetical protein TNCV_204431 [Trichonephila clavipes]